jgi:aspartyl-tRNA(Asn)/glutamyl-tRNA(Gln) amidotransferase subunit B
MKNINSLKNIKAAIESEIIRQKKDRPKEQETRRYDAEKNITVKMRSKEKAEDYRFISDPDLPSINISKKRIEAIKSKLPETPHIKLKRLIKKHKIGKKDAEVLTKKLEIVEFFEKIVDKVDPKLAISWVTVELLRILNYAKKELDEVNITPEHFVELVKLTEKKIITELKAKEILNKFIPKSFSPKKEVEKSKKISGKSEIENFARKVIKENPQAVQDYASGKEQAMNFLVGQVMRVSNKRADFKVAKETLEKILK